MDPEDDEYFGPFILDDKDWREALFENSGFDPDFDPQLDDAWYGCESY